MALRNFPTGAQSEFLVNHGPFFQGTRYAFDQTRDHLISGIIRSVTEVAETNTVTVTFGANGDVFGVVIDGLAITAVAATSDAVSAVALDAAIQSYIDTYGTSLVASVAVATNVVTVVFGDALPHSVTALNSGTTSSVVAETVAAASYPRLNFGLGVTIDASAGFDLTGPDLRAIKAASSGSDTLLGVLAYDYGAQMSPYQITALGYEVGYLAPVNPYMVVAKGSVVVPWVGTLPTAPGAGVYWINAPATLADRGKWRSDANGGEADLVNGFVEGIIPDANLVKVYFDL